MKKYFPTVVVIFFLAASVFTQTPKTTPKSKPTPDDDVVKISTNLIQVDVTVVDGKGKVVTDLRPDEIEIYENGQKQTISNFSFVSSVKTESQPARQPKPNDKADAVPLPPTAAKPENVRRAIAILIDDLTISFQSMYYVRNSLKKFVDEQMQEGDLVAIVRTGVGIGTLQQFTTDKRLLYSIIDRLRWNPHSLNGAADFASVGTDLVSPKSAKTEREDPDETSPDKGESEIQSGFRVSKVDTLRYVVDGMRDLPGRKSILLVSSDLTMKELKGGPGHGFTDNANLINSIYKLIDKANRNAVVINTLDARGLVTTFFTAEDNTSRIRSRDMGPMINARDDQVYDSQEGLSYLARQTGGTFFFNNNDLSRGIRKILDDQSYYLVGFQPEGDTFDPKAHKFNQLVVKVTRPGLKVRYRSGFISQTDEQVSAETPHGDPGLTQALTSPFGVGGIAVRLNSLFTNDAKQGSFIRNLVHVDTKDLKFSDGPDGSKNAVLDLLAVAYGDNGVPEKSVKSTYTVKLSKERYEQLMGEGIMYDFSFPVKRPGPYQMRFALVDHDTKKVGSANQFVEVPDLKNNRLTLSGVFVENLTAEQWTKRAAMSDADAMKDAASNPLADTSFRRFKHGTVLNYGFVVFNAKLDAAHQLKTTSTIRMFCDGKLVFEGRPKQLSLDSSADAQRISSSGSISLGKDLPAGDYVIEIVVKDELAKKKQQVATQFVQFEVID